MKWFNYVNDLIKDNGCRDRRIDPWERINVRFDKNTQAQPYSSDHQIRFKMGLEISMTGYCTAEHMQSAREDFISLLKRELYGELIGEAHRLMSELRYGDRDEAEQRLGRLIMMMEGKDV